MLLSLTSLSPYISHLYSMVITKLCLTHLVVLPRNMDQEVSFGSSPNGKDMGGSRKPLKRT